MSLRAYAARHGQRVRGLGRRAYLTEALSRLAARLTSPTAVRRTRGSIKITVSFPFTSAATATGAATNTAPITSTSGAASAGDVWSTIR
jgi:hypothetical protein